MLLETHPNASPTWLDRFQTVVFGAYVLSLPSSISGMEIFSTLLVLILLFRFYKGSFRGAGRPPFFVPAMVFIGIAVLSVLLGVKSGFSNYVHDLGFLRFLVLYFFLYYQIAHFSVPARWLRLLWLVTLVIGLYAIAQHFAPLDLIRPGDAKIIHYAVEDEKLGPVSLGTFDWHLTFASVILMHASLFFSLAIFYFPKKLWLFAHAAILCVACLWTKSRMAWFATPFTMALLTLERSRKFFLGGLIAIILMGMAAFALDSGMQQRVARTFSKNEGYNFSWRRCTWRVHWELFQQNPVLGVGFHNNGEAARALVPQYCPNPKTRFVGNAHSTPLEILATTGALGFVAFCVFWVAVFRHAWRVYRSLARGSLERCVYAGAVVGLIGFLIQGLTQLNFYEPAVAHNMAFFLALVAGMETCFARTRDR